MTDLAHLTTCLRNARVVVRDSLTYLYVMSEHQADMTRYNLGRGAFSSSIALFATLNLLAKIHCILSRGASVIVDEEQIKTFNHVKDQIKQAPNISWAEVRPFMQKPRIGTVNESDAFASFIQDCPVDFGLPRNDSDKVRRIWASYRNKLTHLVALANDVQSGQMLMGLSIQPSQSGMYEENLKFIRGRMDKYKPFDLPAAETKSVFKDKEDISAFIKQHILNDKCHVERLAVAVDLSLDWLVKSIDEGVFKAENLAALAGWLQLELAAKVD